MIDKDHFSGSKIITAVSTTETHFSCDTVGRELRLAILSSLLCPETDWNIGKQSYVFILTGFKN